MSSRPRIAIPVPTSMDSAYNRRCLPLYLNAVDRSGGIPVTVPLDGTAGVVADGCAGVLLPGSLADVAPSGYGQGETAECGPPDAAREKTDTTLLEDAERHGKPVFGICYGLQMLNVWRGGSLLQHLGVFPVNHAAGASVAIAHTIVARPDSILASLIKPETSRGEGDALRVMVNSSHHQAVAALGDGLYASAMSPDDGVIEGIEAGSDDRTFSYVLGVQWHPERSYEQSPASRALFDRLISEARA